MSELNKDKVLEDFSKAYQAANGKKPTIDANNGWYSVNDGKNMRLADLDDWTKTLKKESKKASKKESATASKPAEKDAKTNVKAKGQAKRQAKEQAKDASKSATTKAKPTKSKKRVSTKAQKSQSRSQPTSKAAQPAAKTGGVKSSAIDSGNTTAGLSAKDAWRQYLASLAGDSTLPRGNH